MGIGARASPPPTATSPFVVESLNEGRLDEPHAVEGECDPVPSADTHVPRDAQAWGLSLPDRPILLVDIDRLLETSADVELLGRSGPIRTWRDALTVVLELLTYAREILAADMAILRHPPTGQGPDRQSLVDVLPGLVASPSWGDGWSEPAGGVDDLDDLDDLDDFDDLDGLAMDANFFTWAAGLTSAHEEMARTDLSEPADVVRALAVVEEQLTALTERQQAVEARLQRIRRVIVREHQERAARARDRPA